MLTRNGRNTLAFMGVSKTRGLKSVNGTATTSALQNLTNLFAYATISVGTGTTVASVEDYNLENKLTTGLTISVVSKSNMNANRDYSSDEGLMFVNCLVTNETENDITLTEIGIIISTGDTYPDNSTFLLTRSVLADGLVLEAGKTYQIRVDIN